MDPLNHERYPCSQVVALKHSMLEIVRGLPASTRVGIATYAASVAVYDLSAAAGVASAEVRILNTLP